MRHTFGNEDFRVEPVAPITIRWSRSVSLSFCTSKSLPAVHSLTHSVVEDGVRFVNSSAARVFISR